MRTTSALIPLSLIFSLGLVGCGSSGAGSNSPTPAPAQTQAPEPMKAIALLEQVENRIQKLKKDHKCESQIKEIAKGLELKEYEFTFGCPGTSVDTTEAVTTDINSVSKLIDDNIQTSVATLSQVNALTAYNEGLKKESQRLSSFKASFVSALDAAVITNTKALAKVKCTSSLYPNEITIQCDPPSTLEEGEAQEKVLEESIQRINNHPYKESSYDSYSGTRTRVYLPQRYYSYAQELSSKKSTTTSQIRIFQWAILNQTADTLNTKLKTAYGIELSQGALEFLKANIANRYYRPSLESTFEGVKRVESILGGKDGDLYFKSKGIKILEITKSWNSDFFSPETGTFRLRMNSDLERMEESFEELLALPTTEYAATLKSYIQQVKSSGLVAGLFSVQCKTVPEKCVRILKIFMDNRTPLAMNTSVDTFSIRASNKSLTVTERTSAPTLFFTGDESEEAILKFFKKHYTTYPPSYRY